MNDGKFVSDEIVNKLIENLVSDPQKKNKLIFDGYPRSLSQAKNLDKLLKISNQKIDLILFLNVNKKTIKYLFSTIQSTTCLMYTVLSSGLIYLKFECQFLQDFLGCPKLPVVRAFYVQPK